MVRGFKRLALIAVLLAGYALVYFHRTMTGVVKGYIDTFALYYGVDEKLLTATFFSAYFYAYALSQLFTGVFLDTYGTRRACTLFLLGLSAATALMALPSPVTLVAGRALVGFFGATVFLAAQRSASLLFGKERQATITGFLLMVGNLSAALGTYPLVVFLEHYGLVKLLGVLALIALLVGALVFALSEDPGGRVKGLGIVNFYKGFLKIARDPHAWSVALAAVAAHTVLSFQSGWGQVYFGDLGIGVEVTGLYLMYLALLIALLVLIVGYLSDIVIKRRKVFLEACGVLVVFSWILALYVYNNRRVDLVPMLLVVFAAAFATHITAPPMAKEPYGVDYAATSISFFNIVLFSSLALMLTLSAYLTPQAMCVLSAVIGFLALVLTVVFAKETLGSPA